MIGVKICGITTPAQAHIAVEAGADFIGLVFAPSRRRITLDQARKIVAAMQQAAAQRVAPVEAVGVFVNEAATTINTIAAEVGLDRVQLSGHETPSILPMLRFPAIKAIRFDEHAGEAAWLALMDQAEQELSLLVDAHVPGSFGGAGVTTDWQRALALARRYSLWLAGGLTPDNVAVAIQTVHPRVVDVSSGVETDGVKDAAKIQVFTRIAKQASQQV